MGPHARPDRGRPLGGSPFVQVTRGRKIDVRLATPMLYELDGGERDPVTRLRAKVVPGALTVRVPEQASP